MKDSSKKKLTLFSRLWAVSVILLAVLCIVGVIGGMNENKDMMGVSMVGTSLMFLVLVCQLVTSIIVRRWWCVAGCVFGILVSLFVMGSSIAALAAGQYRPPVMEAAETDTVFYSYEDDRISCSIVALVPVDGVDEEFNEWLGKELGGGYKGDRGGLQALVDYYGEAHVDTLRSTLEDGVPDYAELSYEAVMDKIYESDKVVTYALTVYLDFGGAHPLTRETGATFSKEDGKHMTWDIVRSDRRAELNDVLKDMLKTYFDAGSDRELMDVLQGVKSVSELPLPSTPPYMTETGYVVIYQQYEIAPYAMGMPGDTIPYNTLKPYLTEQAQELIPTEEDYSFPVEFKGEAPSMSDFVKALSRQEDPGELLAYIEKKKKKQCGDDCVIYFSRDSSDRFVWTDTTEICCWDNSDGRHKTLVVIHRDYTNGEIIAGQYSGLSIYVYDASTRRMEMTGHDYLGIEPPEINGLDVYTVSAKDKTVTVSVNNPDEGSESRTYRWDGGKFIITKP